MKYLRVLLTSAMVVVLLIGCSGDDEQKNVPTPPPAPAPGPGPSPTLTDFTSFVRQLLASTAENTDPTPLEGIVFSNQLAEGDPQPISSFLP